MGEVNYSLYTTGFVNRRGNCHGNAITESFFKLLKRECILRRVSTDCEEARRNVFDFIVMFYNSACRHSYADGPSPVQFEHQ